MRPIDWGHSDARVGLLACRGMDMPPTWGDYGSVFLTNDQVVSGLIYDPNTGEFHLRVTGDSDLMLSDPAPIPGPVANIVFEYRTTFDRAGVTPGGSDISCFAVAALS
jgi:hypothetical protein